MDIGSTANPYKVSQLQAMRWTVHAWVGLDQSVFANCWKHTGLVSIPSSDCVHFDLESNNALSASEYHDTISQLGIQDPLPLDDFIEPPNESDDTHKLLTDAEIVELAVRVEEPELEPCEEGETSLCDTLSPRDQIIALGRTISIIENQTMHQDATVAVDVLRRIQRDLRWKIREEERIRHVHAAQPSITSFFNSKS